jgi:hypothetical protein
MRVQQGAIIVSTPIRTQVFKISRKFLDSLETDWLKLVSEYYSQIERCGVYDADLI